MCIRDRSKNRRICKNSRNSLTSDILNATQGLSLNLLFKTENLQPNELKKSNQTMLYLTPGPLASRFVRKVPNRLMIEPGVAVGPSGQINNSVRWKKDTTLKELLRRPPAKLVAQP